MDATTDSSPRPHIHELDHGRCRICGWDGTRIQPGDTLRVRPAGGAAR